METNATYAYWVPWLLFCHLKFTMSMHPLVFPNSEYIICTNLRVNTVLEDRTMKEKYHVGSWHIFLPSEVCFGWSRCVSLTLVPYIYYVIDIYGLIYIRGLPASTSTTRNCFLNAFLVHLEYLGWYRFSCRWWVVFKPLSRCAGTWEVLGASAIYRVFQKSSDPFKSSSLIKMYACRSVNLLLCI